MDEAQVEKEVPDDGILLDDVFPSRKAGHYEVRNRVGFEFVRSPFEWRLDNAPWPKPIPGAQIAWTAAFDGSDESAVVCAKQWNNPRPGVSADSSSCSPFLPWVC